MDRAITIRDAAREAGVSVATISRVASGSAGVSDATRIKVNEVLMRLGWEPSRLGQGLALNRHRAFALVLPGLGGPFFAGLLNGFERALAGARFTPHILVAQDEELFQLQIHDLATRVDGMCVFGSFAGDGIISTLAGRMPIVRIAGNPDKVTHSVNVNNFEASRELTSHLIHIHGLSDLVFLGEIAQSPDVQQRFLGFQRALADAGFSSHRRIVSCSLTQASGLRATNHILAQAERPQGLVCASDEVAIGALMACAAAGVTVPGDLKVTGFDDTELASLVTPALTTADQPFEELGAEAAKLLLRYVDPKTRSDQQENTWLPTELVVRRSCGC